MLSTCNLHSLGLDSSCNPHGRTEDSRCFCGFVLIPPHFTRANTGTHRGKILCLALITQGTYHRIWTGTQGMEILARGPFVVSRAGQAGILSFLLLPVFQEIPSSSFAELCPSLPLAPGSNRGLGRWRTAERGPSRLASQRPRLVREKQQLTALTLPPPSLQRLLKSLGCLLLQHRPPPPSPLGGWWSLTWSTEMGHPPPTPFLEIFRMENCSFSASPPPPAVPQGPGQAELSACVVSSSGSLCTLGEG